MQPDSSSPLSQQPDISPYPETHNSNPHTPIFLSHPSKYSSAIYILVFQMHSFPRVSPLNSFMYPVPYMPHSPPIQSYFLWSPNHIQWAVWITKLLLVLLSPASSYHRSLGPNTSLHTWNSNALNQWYYYSATNFHTHTKQQLELLFCVF